MNTTKEKKVSKNNLFNSVGEKQIDEGFLYVGEKIPNSNKMKTINIINGKYKAPFRKAI